MLTLFAAPAIAWALAAAGPKNFPPAENSDAPAAEAEGEAKASESFVVSPCESREDPPATDDAGNPPSRAMLLDSAEVELKGDPDQQRIHLRSLEALAAADWSAARDLLLRVGMVDDVQARTLVAFASKAELHAWMKRRGLPVGNVATGTTVERAMQGAGCFDASTLQYTNPPDALGVLQGLARHAPLKGVSFTQPAEGPDPGCDLMKKAASPRTPNAGVDASHANDPLPPPRATHKVLMLKAKRGAVEVTAPMTYLNCHGDGFGLDLSPPLSLLNDLLRAQKSPLRFVVATSDIESATVLLGNGDALDAAHDRGLL